MDSTTFENILSVFGESFDVEMANLGNVCIVVDGSQQPITYPKRTLKPFDYLIFLYTVNTCQQVFQLSHEIMHVITDCEPTKPELKKWGEGLSVAATIYILRRFKEIDEKWTNYYNDSVSNAKEYCGVSPQQGISLAEAIYNNKDGWHAVSYLHDYSSDKTLADIRDNRLKLCQNEDETNFINTAYKILAEG
jgi:hypothetical protein